MGVRAGRHGVVLNGAVYEEGGYVGSNLLLKSVERDRVEFVYKGLAPPKNL